jgi:hypothetical protein
VQAIAAGTDYGAALKTDGSVVVWGGFATEVAAVPIAARSGVRAIAGTGNCLAALKTNGSVVVWGNNRDGQAKVPPVIQGRTVAISTGSFHTVAIVADEQPPVLSIVESPDGTTAAWPATANGFALQHIEDLGEASWQPAAGTTGQTDGLNTLTMTPLVPARFYRLFKP